MGAVAFPRYLSIARDESLKSTLSVRVGACLVAGKSIITGYNKDKTHPKYANPEKHVRKSLHAELDCLTKSDIVMTGGVMHTYRQVKGMPAMARPCGHCMKFLKERGIRVVVYSTPEFPYYREEQI